MRYAYKSIGPRWRHLLGLGTYETTSWCACYTPFRSLEKIVNSHGSILWSSGLLEIPPGVQFAPTGPVPDTSAMVAASLFHDELYACGVEGLLSDGWRAKADKLMYEHMRAGGSRVYAPIAWAGVRCLYPPVAWFRALWEKVT